MKRIRKILFTGLIALVMILGSGGMVWAAVTIGSTPGISIGTAATGLTFTGAYTATAIQLGTSGSELSLAADGDYAVDINTTSPSTNTSTSVEPFHMISTMTGTGGVGGRALFEMDTEVVLGGWANALKGYIDFGTAGSVTGLGSAIVAEMRLPAKALTAGNYAPLEIELVVQSGGTTGPRPVSFTYARASGETAALNDFNETGYFMSVQGLTGAATDLLSLTSQTLKSRIGSSTRYLVLSQLEDGLGLGNSSTSMDLTTTSANKAIAIYTTSPSTSSGTSVQPVFMQNTMTGTGGVGGRAYFGMDTEAVLGGWANALKAYIDFGTAGSVTGLASAIVAEMRMPAKSLVGGNYAPLEIELVLQNDSRIGASPGVSFIYAQAVADGSSGGLDDFISNGYVMSLQGLGSADTSKIFQANSDQATHALRILIGSTPYYLLMTTVANGTE